MKESRSVRWTKYIVLWGLALVVLFPLLIVLVISFKSEESFLKTSFLPVFPLILGNYGKVWVDAEIPSVALTSLLITFFSVAGQIFIGALAAYALTKMKFQRANLFAALFLIPMIFSVQTVIFPIFLMYSGLHLLNTHLGLILIYIATGLAACIFIFTRFMRSVSGEISEAAMIDGAGHGRIFFQIILPLTKAQVSTVAVINGLGVWNDFFLPLMLFTNGELSTLPLSMYTFTTEYGLKWTLVSADIIFMLLPMLVIYLLLQKYIVAGVAAGAVKG